MSGTLLFLFAALLSVLHTSWGVVVVKHKTRCIDSVTNLEVPCPPESPEVVAARNHKRIVIIGSTLGVIGFIILVAAGVTYWIQGKRSKDPDQETLHESEAIPKGYNLASPKGPADERL